MSTYTRSPVLKWLTAIGLPAMLVIVASAIVGSIQHGIQRDDSAIIIGLQGLVLLALVLGCSYLVLNALLGKLTVTDHSLQLTTALGTRELKFSEIRGFRNDSKRVTIYPAKPLHKKMIISSEYFIGTEFTQWLNQRFTDLDTEERGLEKENILADRRYGTDAESRKMALDKARSLVLPLTVIAIFLSVTVVDNELLRATLLPIIAYPFVLAVLMKYHKGLIRLETCNNTPYPSFLAAFIIITSVILLKGMLNFKILHYTDLAKPAGVVSFILLLLIMWKNPQLKGGAGRVAGRILGWSLMCLAFAFGSVVCFNCIYDSGRPKQYYSRILSKWVHHGGRGTSHYFLLSPWGPVQDLTKERVRAVIYRKYGLGDSVKIVLHTGKIGASWYTLESSR